jgi:hypothetical protein
MQQRQPRRHYKYNVANISISKSLLSSLEASASENREVIFKHLKLSGSTVGVKNLNNTGFADDATLVMNSRETSTTVAEKSGRRREVFEVKY